MDGCQWQGPGTDPQGHAVFTDPVYGVRAGILLLRAYFFTYNLRTVAENLACGRQPMTPSFPAGRTSQLTHDYSVTVGEHKDNTLSKAMTVLDVKCDCRCVFSSMRRKNGRYRFILCDVLLVLGRIACLGLRNAWNSATASRESHG
jgi:hypothetical protein